MSNRIATEVYMVTVCDNARCNAGVAEGCAGSPVVPGKQPQRCSERYKNCMFSIS